MARLRSWIVALALSLAWPAWANEPLPTGTLRAAFLATNPAQATTNRTTGEIRGPVADLTREFARRLGVPYTLMPTPGVAAVIDTVTNIRADIGFIAYDRTRAEHVGFSQNYLLAHNAYIVRADSSYQSSAELDRPGLRIGIGERDAGDLFLTRNLKSAELRRVANSNLAEGIRLLVAGEIAAYGANRTRLIAAVAQQPGLRILNDNFYSVEQAIVVPKGHPQRLALIERLIVDARASGMIQAAIDNAGIKGVDVAPASAR